MGRVDFSNSTDLWITIGFFFKTEEKLIGRCKYTLVSLIYDLVWLDLRSTVKAHYKNFNGFKRSLNLLVFKWINIVSESTFL